MFAFTRYGSPVGELTIVAGPAGLRALLWPGEGWQQHMGVNGAELQETATAVIDATRAQLDGYFAGELRRFDLPLDPVGTPFQLAAWMVLRTIPYGETFSYGKQARALGDPNKARAVGAANGRNPISIIVPCHRVVGSTGKLTGFGGGLPAKEWLLDHERRHRAAG